MYLFRRGITSTISFTHPFLYLPVGEPTKAPHKEEVVCPVCGLIQKSPKEAPISSALVLLKLYMIYRITENGPHGQDFFWDGSRFPTKIFAFNHIANNDGNNDR